MNSIRSLSRDKFHIIGRNRKGEDEPWIPTLFAVSSISPYRICTARYLYLNSPSLYSALVHEAILFRKLAPTQFIPLSIYLCFWLIVYQSINETYIQSSLPRFLV